MSARGRQSAVLTWLPYLLGWVALAGCDAVRAEADAAVDGGSSDATALACHACHGSAASPAPPRALGGKTATSERGVGAHQVHLTATATRPAVACSECHVVPATVYGAGHLDAKDGKATVTFGSLARARGSQPTWDPATLTCAGVACHGAGLKAQGPHSTPKWTQVDGSQRACGSCHGTPPPPPHPQPNLLGKPLECRACHAATMGPGMQVTPAKHIDGTVDVVFAATACDTCHAAPPPLPKHPPMTACGKCHGDVPKLGEAEIRSGNHLDGKFDLALPSDCNSCHGSALSPMPPPDHLGNTDAKSPAVGAHEAHSKGKAVSQGGIACAACHQLPETLEIPSHWDGSQQTVLFPDGKATWKGSKPKYDPATQTCSGVYCHGAKMDSPAVAQPKWNAGELPCNGCHGVPPPTTSGHVQTDPAQGTKACAQCHKLTVKPDGALDLVGGHHVDGKVDP